MSSLARFLAGKFARQLGALALSEAQSAGTSAAAAVAAAALANAPLAFAQFGNGGVLGPALTIPFNIPITPLRGGKVELNVSFNGTTVGAASAQVIAQLTKGATPLRTVAVNAGAANGVDFFGTIPFLDVAPAVGLNTYVLTLTCPSNMTVSIGSMWAIIKELPPNY